MVFGTVTGTLQIDQFPTVSWSRAWLQPQDFTNLEDENRSSLQIHDHAQAVAVDDARGPCRDVARTSASPPRRAVQPRAGSTWGVIYSR